MNRRGGGRTEKARKKSELYFAVSGQMDDQNLYFSPTFFF